MKGKHGSSTYPRLKPLRSSDGSRKTQKWIHLYRLDSIGRYRLFHWKIRKGRIDLIKGRSELHRRKKSPSSIGTGFQGLRKTNGNLAIHSRYQRQLPTFGPDPRSGAKSSARIPVDLRPQGIRPQHQPYHADHSCH